MTPQTRESIATSILVGGVGAFCLAWFLITKTTALGGLVRVAALVVFGDAS